MNNVDPLAWLTQTLERIANGWPSSEIDALMPWNYAASTASACRLQRSYGLRRMRWRGLAKAGVQVRLTDIAYNMKRSLKIIAMAG